MKENFDELFKELEKDETLSQLREPILINDKSELDNSDLKKQREIFEYRISSILDMVYGRNYCTSDELEGHLNLLFLKIYGICKTNNEKYIETVLGGELNKDAVYKGAEINEERKKLPLYFILDLIIGILQKKNVDDYYNDREAINDIISKFKLLRTRVALLNFDSKFKPTETIDDDTLDFIIENKGIFELEKERKNGFDYLIATDIEHRSMPIYRSDKDMIIDIEFSKKQKDRERLNKIGERYFKSGQVPKVGYFNEELIDKDVDLRIKNILLSICIEKAKDIFDQELSDLIINLMDKLEKTEKIVGENKVVLKQNDQESISDFEDKDVKITLARLRYRQKSALWKFFHKKLNPERLNFDSMSESEIDNLYRGRR